MEGAREDGVWEGGSKGVGVCERGNNEREGGKEGGMEGVRDGGGRE